ncbi:hypothetical protein CURTO8I2_190057 [Curtobacterium sp. 8I-2]|nr:hypothetical protein CURTO8I2_190057 [Curtobacterium sp. 8I-2]
MPSRGREVARSQGRTVRRCASRATFRAPCEPVAVHGAGNLAPVGAPRTVRRPAKQHLRLHATM